MRKTRNTSKLHSSKSCLIYGASGRMGRELIDCLNGHAQYRLEATVSSKEILAFDEKHTAVLKRTPSSLVAVLQGADYVIDFSSIEGTRALVTGLSKVEGKTILIGTTGLGEKERSSIVKVAKAHNHKILMAGNTSLGVATLSRLARSAAIMLKGSDFDIEVVEGHHRMKADAPSGTAILIAKVVQSARPDLEVVFNRTGKRKAHTIGIHSIRGGGIIGEHSIRFIGANEELSLSHRAFERSLFASGAIKLLGDIESKVKSGRAVDLLDFLVE